MKNLILLPLLSSSVLYASLSVAQIENMVKRIHLKREGVDLDTLENTKEPFVLLKKEDNVTVIEIPNKEEDIKLNLHAIMAGKAYINDSWKKIDDKVFGYTVKYIGKKGVVLRNGNTVKRLFLGKPKNDFIKLEERE